MTDRLPDDVTLAHLNASPAPRRRPVPTEPAVEPHETPPARQPGVKSDLRAAPVRKPAPPLAKATRTGGTRRSAKPTALGTKIAVTGVGVAAMLGLVGSMEAKGLDQSAAADPGSSASTNASVASVSARQSMSQRAAAAKAAKAEIKARQPIVLTPHTVVNVVHVAAPASSGGGGYSGGGYSSAPSYSAPSSSAPAAAPAAPVASSSGSR